MAEHPRDDLGTQIWPSVSKHLPHNGALLILTKALRDDGDEQFVLLVTVQDDQLLQSTRAMVDLPYDVDPRPTALDSAEIVECPRDLSVETLAARVVEREGVRDMG